MNIKNRLTKIEDKLNINSNVCHCPRETLFKVVPFDEQVEDEPEVICNTCHKAIPSRPPVTFNLGNAEINVIEPTTNFTREEFDAWQNTHVIGAHMTYEQYLTEKEQA